MGWHFPSTGMLARTLMLGVGQGNRTGDTGQAAGLWTAADTLGNVLSHLFPSHKPYLCQSSPTIKILASPPHVGPGSRRTWHCRRDCRKPSFQLSTASWAVSQRSPSWLTLPWSLLDSALSVCRKSLLLMLTETTKAL